ncbi:MAG: hypothetical protein JW723_08520 [Bacteroidales bacterium]|nr:hypothetical protein [Bacteroidales bacterium]
MNRIIILMITFTLTGSLSNSTIFAQDNEKEITLKNIARSTIISGQYFMAYNYDNKADLHQFLLKRGYFTINTGINDVFAVRYTQDITIDKEGGDAGNVELRLKYLYLRGKFDQIPLLKHSYIELGLVHRPWLEFEEHINQYRVQGTMFVERNSIINSADFGITCIGLLGGEMNEEYRKKVNNHEAGKYGSFAIGIFNGGGYHAIEKNSNKTIETRISLRPFPDFIPGLQFSHGLAYGDANLPDSIPEFRMNLFMLSSESRYHKFTFQYYTGKGDFSGTYTDEFNRSYDTEGYSLFGEFLIPKTRFAVFSRYDHFRIAESPAVDKNTFIAGISYRFFKNKLLIDYQKFRSPERTTNYYEFALEIAF